MWFVGQFIFVCLFCIFLLCLIFETESGSVASVALELLRPSNPPASSSKCLAP